MSENQNSPELQNVKELSDDDELRVKVAELCGTLGIPGFNWYFDKYGKKRIYEDKTDLVPNYPVDLNAMAKAEKIMTVEQRMRYRQKLAANSDGPNAEFISVEDAMCHATARQRAEALVLVFVPPLKEPRSQDFEQL